MHRLLNILLAIVLVTAPVSADSQRLRDQAIPRASAPALPLVDVLDLPESALPKTPSASTDWIPVGTTRFDLQTTGSISRMIAVSGDGMVHGAYMGGTYMFRRALGWCVDPVDMTILGPTELWPSTSGYTTVAVTGPDPANWLAPFSTVVGFHGTNPSGSWFGVDSGGCNMAFSMVPHTGSPLWPQVAVDGQDRVHLVARGSGAGEDANSVFYDSSTNGTVWDNGYLLVTNNTRSPGAVLVGNTHSSRAALLFHEKTGAADVPYDGPPEESEIGVQLHHDVMAFIAADGVLADEIAADNRINLTSYGPGSESPFGPYGCRAYADVDGLFDFTTNENLHTVFSTCVMFTDTLTVHDGDGDSTPLVYYHWNLGRGQIWHTSPDTGEWSHVAGYNSAVTEEDQVYARPQARRMFVDLPTIAVDPTTGYLYTVWSEYSRADTSAAGYYNGEIMARCSADNGLTWGPKVNLTETPGPGCDCGGCPAEDWPCVAAIASGGFLHLTFIQDRSAGASQLAEGCETINDVVYHQVPVTDVPPHTGEPWNGAGHVGLVADRRWFTWECDAWEGDGAYLDSTHWEEPVHVFNESPFDVSVESIRFHHHPSDLMGTPEDGGLLFPDLEVMSGGDWLPVAQWNGQLPQWRGTKFRLHAAYSGLPNFDQLLVFHLIDHPDLVYRIAYESDTEGCPGVDTLDPDDLSEYTSIQLFPSMDVPEVEPSDFTLEAAFPNPFNPATTIAFSLDHAGPTTLTVHNLLGETVATLVDGPVQAGRHTVDFDASALASGVYIYTLEADGLSESRKLVVLK